MTVAPERRHRHNLYVKKNNRAILIWAYVIAILALALDQASKFWALKNLGDGTVRPLLGSFLRLELTANPGAAFSLGSHTTIICTCIACVVVTVIIMYLPRVRSRFLAFGCALLLGGAAGNLVDRFIQNPGWGNGHVVDFIGYGNWFIGNVADIWIVCAVILLFIGSFIGPKRGAH